MPARDPDKTRIDTPGAQVYNFDIAGNGTILEMRNVSIGSKGELVTPLRQWRHLPPFHYGPV
eukprot:COSAG06_NODE_22855_length_710_cov_1.425532_1_plen_62_part_00